VSTSATDWLTERPPESIRAGDLVLTRPGAGDLEEMVAAVNSSLEQLRPWFPWAQQPATDDSVRAYLLEVERSWEEGTGFSFVGRERHDGAPSGGHGGAPSGGIVCGCGLHVRVGPGALEIGYWVRTDRTRRGIATSVAGALTRTAFSLPGVERVQIHCDQSNRPSAGVAAKLGYLLDRTEAKEPAAPGETGRFMVWVRRASDACGEGEAAGRGR
jgi:RimJ/RimL family protein N-acetyltransferase